MSDWEITNEELAEALVAGFTCDKCGDVTEHLIELHEDMLLVCPICARQHAAKTA